jgi:polyisoprenoid-binding protein YceI
MKEHTMSTTELNARQTPTPDIPSRPSRKHHWWRWIVASVTVIIVLVVLALGSFIKQPAPSPLVLPLAAGSTSTGPLNGAWNVAPESVAGFRVRQSAVGVSNDTVGRTNAVTGTLTVSDNQVSSATFRLDLTTIKVGGKPQPQLATSLGTQRNPIATFTLAQPTTLSPAPASGETAKGTATGQLAMNGTSHLVTFTISYRRVGASLLIAGTTPIAFSDWGIKGPQGYGVLGSLADHGVAEVLLVLHGK